MKAKTSSTPRATLKKAAAAPNKRRTKTVAKPAAKKPAAKPVKAKTVKRVVKAAPVKTKPSSTPVKKSISAVASVKTGAKSKVASAVAKKAAKPVEKPPLNATATLVAPPPANAVQEKGKGKKSKPAKKKREKVVRDSYSIPKSQFAQLKAMRTDLAKTGRIASKSELLRAGLALLFRQSTTAVKELIDALTPEPRGKGAKK
ncbi:MAG: hypothetical protein HZA59_04525 [Hydrogenophilales bacterium]|nr:hypothetical protein [Hydrogenophilales bacterium]